MFDPPCYLCKEMFDYYIKHVNPDADFIMKFLPDFKEDSDNLCEKCFEKFRKIFEIQNQKLSSLIDSDLASSSNRILRLDTPSVSVEEERIASNRKRILDEIKKAM